MIGRLTGKSAEPATDKAPDSLELRDKPERRGFFHGVFDKATQFGHTANNYDFRWTVFKSKVVNTTKGAIGGIFIGAGLLLAAQKFLKTRPDFKLGNKTGDSSVADAAKPGV